MSDDTDTNATLAEVLDEAHTYITRFVAFPTSAASVAVTLWVAHAHAIDAFDSSPRLALLSPEPGSGKTRVLETIEVLVPAPMHVLSASAAAIFRSIGADPTPTLLFDEVDAIFGRNGKGEDSEDLRGLLNAGHRKGASIPRCVGATHEVRRFDVYAAVALAGLGDLPDTLMSRSIVVRMRRRAPDEYVEPFRLRRDVPPGHAIRARLARAIGTVRPRIGHPWPDMPDGIEDRPADVWEPLLAMADVAGGEWPSRARSACLALAGASVSREASLGIRLLGDVRAVFGTRDRIGTAELLAGLHAIDEAPWSDLHGKPLDARGLSWRLGHYEVSSRKVKVDGRPIQGYRREDLHDTWLRYLPATEPEPTEPSEPPRSQCPETVPPASRVPEPHSATEPHTPPLTCTVPEVPEVLDLDAYEARYPELFDTSTKRTAP